MDTYPWSALQHSMTMDASLQHTTLGTLHEVRYTATE
jgi:hypothetical protein